jgi:hypothetical protein
LVSAGACVPTFAFSARIRSRTCWLDEIAGTLRRFRRRGSAQRIFRPAPLDTEPNCGPSHSHPVRHRAMHHNRPDNPWPPWQSRPAFPSIPVTGD